MRLFHVFEKSLSSLRSVGETGFEIVMISFDAGLHTAFTNQE